MGSCRSTCSINADPLAPIAPAIRISVSTVGDFWSSSRTATERQDLDVVQAVVEMSPSFTAGVGLEVDVSVATVAY